MTSIAQQLEDVLGGVIPQISGTPAEKNDLLDLCRSGASHSAELYWCSFGCDFKVLPPHERFEIIESLIGKQVRTHREIHASMGLVDPEFDLQMVAAITSAFRQRLEKVMSAGAGGRA